MKFKNIAVIMSVTLFLGIGLSGCENSDAAVSSNQKTGNEHSQLTDNKKQESVQEVRDSINEISGRIEKLSTQLGEISKKVDDTASDVMKLKEDKSNNKWSILIGWGLGLISLILAIAAIITASKYKARLNRHRDEIEKLKVRLSDLKSSSNTHSGNRRANYTGLSSVSSAELTELSRRILSVECELSKMSMLPPPAQVDSKLHNPVSEPISQVNTQNGYFGTATIGEGGQGYFKKLMDYKDEDARFSVKITNDEAEYEPCVSVQNLVSFDYDDAVEFQGVSKRDAANMTVIRTGSAERRGDRWYIKQKVMISLRK